jgi:hypothetical protein
MTTLTINKAKETGSAWVTPAFEVETQYGTATFYFSGEFRRGFTHLSIGIQAYSEMKWTVPAEYGFFVEGFEHDLVNPKKYGERLINIVHPQLVQDNKLNTFKATLKTPFGDINFEGEIFSAHRRQYVKVTSSEIPNGVQLREDTI